MIKTDHGWRIVFEKATLNIFKPTEWMTGISVGEPPNNYDIQIESSIVISNKQGQKVNQGASSEVISSLSGQLCTGIDLHNDGTITISLDDGRSITVDASNKFEPWNLSGPDGLRVVSTTDKSLSIWD